MRTFDYCVQRAGRWWMITIPAINGLTQARHRGQIVQMATEYIAVSQDIPIANIEVRHV